MDGSILPFSSPKATLDRAGGKGANLAELARAGFVVPPGFIIATDGYNAFVEANQIKVRILDLVRGVSAENPEALGDVSIKIRELFDRGAIPVDIEGAIASAYRDLSASKMGYLAVAVRSSATAEDLPGLAFAGQHDTYLNVIGEQAVLEAVKRCWGSLWTARAIAYRERNKIPHDEIALAVVVQEMVASDVSGIIFTANPITGRRDEMVIDASFGLGEAIVSGQVSPDHYIVDAHVWRIRERTLGAKEIAIIPRTRGGTEHIRRDGVAEQALSDEQILELAQTAQHVAQFFGMPQDIEWALKDEKLYVVQSRPITSLYPLPATAKGGLRVYVSFNSIQGVTDPLTPLGVDIIRILFSGFLKLFRLQTTMEQVLPDAGGRLFLDLTVPLHDPALRRFVLAVLARSDQDAQQILLRLIKEGRIKTQRVVTLQSLFPVLPAFLLVLRYVLYALLAPERAYLYAIVAADRFLAKSRQNAGAAKGLPQRLRFMERDLSHAVQALSVPSISGMLSAVAGIPIVRGWLSSWLGERPDAALQLLRGLPHNVTTEMDLRLWNVAQAIRMDTAALKAMSTLPIESLVEKFRQGKLPTIAQTTLEKFLDAYGMRGVTEIDIGRPRWRDDPTPIIQTLRSYIRLEDPNLAPDVVFRRGAEQAERLKEKYIVRAHKKRFGWLRALLLAGAIRRMRVLGGLREVPLFYMVQVLGIYRTRLLDSARELVMHQELDHAEDIFLLSVDVLKRFGQGEQINLKSVVAANRAEYERETRRKQMPRVLLSTGEAFYEGEGKTIVSNNELIGEAVSPGVAEGRVRIILDPHQAHLEPSEILVCPSTDPGWTPLFLTAGALIMEIGGLVTHGSVVAREYGIPAVVGVHNATERLRTGQIVRVDGNRGIVTVLE